MLTHFPVGQDFKDTIGRFLLAFLRAHPPAPNSFCLVIFFHPILPNLTSKSGGWVSRARTTERKIGAVMADLDTTWCSGWPQVRLLQTDGSNKRLMRRFAAARYISVQL